MQCDILQLIANLQQKVLLWISCVYMPKVVTLVDLSFWLSLIINPRRACAAKVTVVVLSFRLSVHLSVCLPVCNHVFCRYVQQDSQ